MERKRVLLTGATGAMGKATLTELIKDTQLDVLVFVRDSAVDRAIIKPFIGLENLEIFYGDLTIYEDILKCMTGVDVVLHCGAFVSPAADDHPELAMRVNYGSMLYLIRAIKAQPNADEIRFVSIGSIAQTGDRMPPIHWGRVGDPIKPSVYDYYAVSKIAAERVLIESGLKHWVSLRQTGILSEKMAKISDPIMFHNCLDNVLEYVTDHDSGVMMRHCCGDLPDAFWGHIYNVGGGTGCRMSGYEMFAELFQSLGFKNIENVIDANWFALRNFHGQYYLDSDRLNDYLNFRSQDKRYFFDLYRKEMGLLVPLCKVINALPRGEKIMGRVIRKRFEGLLHDDRGTLNWIENDRDDYIAPYFISKQHWEAIPRLNEFEHFKDWDHVVPIDHGYDETKPESKLSIEDVKKAASFRGGSCDSDEMIKGDWTSKLQWTCAFGHHFDASPRLVLEGGHWCPECERKSWNYHEIAKVNPFFAQVWNPLHDKDEPSRAYPKVVIETSIETSI